MAADFGVDLPPLENAAKAGWTQSLRIVPLCRCADVPRLTRRHIGVARRAQVLPEGAAHNPPDAIAPSRQAQ